MGGSPIPGATGATHAATLNGSYTVEVTNTATGCTAVSNVVPVTVWAAPVAAISQTRPTTFCQGDSVVLNSATAGVTSRRWNFNGGPASHGSGFHRKPGSVGNRTWPGRVMPGKRMAGQWGNESVSIRNLKIVDIIPEENVVLVRGSVPGARNSLVRLTKV